MSFDTVIAHRTHTYDPDTDRYASSEMGAKGRGAEVQISYDATTKSYTLSNSATTAIFDPTELAASSGDMRNYEAIAGSVTDRLALYGNLDPAIAVAGNSLQLRYLSFGSWSRTDAVTEETKTFFLLFGFPTTQAKMPTTGTASYSGTVSANFVDVRDHYAGALAGTATLSANFGAGTVSTDLTLTNLVGNTYAIVQGTGPIDGDQFMGAFSSPSSTFHSGGFMGGFFGPEVDEMGYTFWLRMTPKDPYAGASLRIEDYRIVGAVVGNKN